MCLKWVSGHFLAKASEEIIIGTTLSESRALSYVIADKPVRWWICNMCVPMPTHTG